MKENFKNDGRSDILKQDCFYLTISGKNFKPKNFLKLENFSVISCFSKGEQIKLGANGLSKFATYACVVLESKSNIFSKFLTNLYEQKKLFLDTSIEEKVLQIDYDGRPQGNFEFSSNEIKMIYDLGLSLGITCTQLETEDEI